MVVIEPQLPQVVHGSRVQESSFREFPRASNLVELGHAGCGGQLGDVVVDCR